MSDQRIDKIVECIKGLDLDKDYTSGGLPRVESLEAITGIAEITGEERGKAWEIYQAKSATPPEEPKESKPKDEIPEQKIPVAPKPKKVVVKPPEVKKPKAPFTIAEGKSFTSPTGILGPGAPVTPDCLGIDKETFDNFVEKGYIDDNGS